MSRRPKTEDRRRKLRNEMTNRSEAELGEAKFRKAGTEAQSKSIRHGLQIRASGERSIENDEQTIKK